MARDLPSGMSAAIAAGTVQVAVFCEMEWPSATVRAWTGVGPFVWGGNTFTGVGDVGGITPAQESTDGRANGITLTLSGIPTDIVAATVGEYYQGRSANIWFGLLNSAGTALVSTTPYNHFGGRMDVGSYQADGRTATISITVENRMVILQQANGRRRTHEDQQLDYPGDLGFEYVVSSNKEQIDNWGQPGNSIPNKMHGASRQTF